MIGNLLCPECYKETLHKMGFVISGRRKVQRYMCNSCYRTTMKPLVKEETEATLAEGKAPVSRIEINGIAQC